MKTTGLKGSEVLALIEQDKIVSCKSDNPKISFFDEKFGGIRFALSRSDNWSVTYKPIVITLEDVEAVLKDLRYLVSCPDLIKQKLIAYLYTFLKKSGK